MDRKYRLTEALLFALFTVIELMPSGQCSDLFLHGRIEEVMNPSYKGLPKELCAEAYALGDARADRVNVVAPALKSFPLTLRGDWKGTLKIIDIDFTDKYEQEQPSDFHENRRIAFPGATADAEFRFYIPFPGALHLSPPTIKLKEEGTTRKYQFVLDATSGLSVSRENVLSARLIKNEIKALAPTIVEQDIIVAFKLKNKSTGKEQALFSEAIFRFTKTRPFVLHVDFVIVDYSPDGSLWERELLQGDLY